MTRRLVQLYLGLVLYGLSMALSCAANGHRGRRGGGGWLLGGTLGLVTLVYALAIGPLVHLLLPRLSVELREP